MTNPTPPAEAPMRKTYAAINSETGAVMICSETEIRRAPECPDHFAQFRCSEIVEKSAADREIAALRAENERFRAALEWYAEQVSGCRKIGIPGDPFRHALDADGGKRAARALNPPPGGQGT